MIRPCLSGLARNMSFRKLGWSLSLLLAMAIASSGAASAAIIAQWTYEVNTPADLTNSAVGPTVLADIGTGTQTALHASANSDWTTPVGNGSANSYSVNEWAVGDYFQFEVSTLGLNTVTLAWDQTSSSTGPGVFDLEYRVGNSGAFTVFLNDYVVLPNSATAPGAGTWSSTTPISAYSPLIFPPSLPSTIKRSCSSVSRWQLPPTPRPPEPSRQAAHRGLTISR